MYKRMFLYYFPLRVVLPIFDSLIIFENQFLRHGGGSMNSIHSSSADYLTHPHRSQFAQPYFIAVMGMNLLNAHFALLIYNRGWGKKKEGRYRNERNNVETA